MKNDHNVLIIILVLLACSVYASDYLPVKPLPFEEKELLSREIRDTYKGDYLDMIAFPLGGIGTGCISFSGTGRLVDWEIFNNPNKGYQPRHSFLSIWAKAEGDEPVFKVLEGQIRERLDGPLYMTSRMFQEGNGIGPQAVQGLGFPRFRESVFSSRFPFAQVNLKDKKMPVNVVVEAWSPFIPGNDRDSSIPVAIFYVTVANVSDKLVETSIGLNVQNCAGADNELIVDKNFTAMYMTDGSDNGNSMFIASLEKPSSYIRHWPYDDQFMVSEHFRRTFVKDGKFNENTPPKRESSHAAESAKIASLGFSVSLKPKESKTLPLIIGWYFPLFDTAGEWETNGKKASWRNYYAEQWQSGIEVAKYVVSNLDRLEDQTRLFQQTFFESTLPGVVLESVSTNLGILRSPTIIRYPDGTMYGWEGCAHNKRLGYGTCNHVWNYQQAIPYLFPAAQRSMLENFYFNGLRESDGAIQHRMPAGPGAKAKGEFFDAADGQLGMISQVYRDWQIYGQDDWLRTIWPKVKKSLEYAWVVWDTDKDGIIEGPAANTLDLKFNTPETMSGSQYQSALLAAEKMALYLGENESAKEYRRVYESGKKLSDEKLFNGDYYWQMQPAEGDYQLGTGSVSEQLHGQLYARMLGLGDIFDRDNIHTALASLFKNHYIDDFYDRFNSNRVYSLGGDRGLLIATWPRGGRPVKPVLYCDETQAGYEYQVAGNLLYEGYILEGLTVIKSIRDRYDGKKRNPFYEFEWGHHYARSLGSYNALLALSGFRYSAVDQMLRVVPKVCAEDFKCFFSVGSAWGLISQKKDLENHVIKVDLKSGTMKIKKINTKFDKTINNAMIFYDNRKIPATITKAEDERWDSDEMYTITFDETVDVSSNKELIVSCVKKE